MNNDTRICSPPIGGSCAQNSRNWIGGGVGHWPEIIIPCRLKLRDSVIPGGALETKWERGRERADDQESKTKDYPGRDVSSLSRIRKLISYRRCATLSRPVLGWCYLAVFQPRSFTFALAEYYNFSTGNPRFFPLFICSNLNPRWVSTIKSTRRYINRFASRSLCYYSKLNSRRNFIFSVRKNDRLQMESIWIDIEIG